MTEATLDLNSGTEWNETLPEEYIVSRWYAASTCPRHEKRVAEQLAARGVNHFLPLYHSVRRWKDRRVRLALPLFPGYIFAHLALRDRLRVLELPGVCRFVGFNGRPTALLDQEVETLRDGLAADLGARPHPYLIAGRRVRITAGPLAGAEGILERLRGKHRVVLSIDLIMRSVAVEVGLADLEPIPQQVAIYRRKE